MHHSEVIQIVSINIIDLEDEETEIRFEHRDFRKKIMGLRFKPEDKLRKKNSPHNDLFSSSSKIC